MPDNNTPNTRRGSEFVIAVGAIVVQLGMVGLAIATGGASATLTASVLGTHGLIAVYIACRSWVKVAEIKANTP